MTILHCNITLLSPDPAAAVTVSGGLSGGGLSPMAVLAAGSRVAGPGPGAGGGGNLSWSQAICSGVNGVSMSSC